MTNRQHQRHASAFPNGFGSPISGSGSNGFAPTPALAIRRSSLPASMLPISPPSSPPGSPALRSSPLTAAISNANNNSSHSNGFSSGMPRSPSASTLSHHSRAHSAVLAPLAHSSTFSWPISGPGMGSPPTSPGTPRSSSSYRYAEPTYEDPMRIAFIGPHDSGKTTFIKSFVCAPSSFHLCGQ
jgi:hypothetical protein